MTQLVSEQKTLSEQWENRQKEFSDSMDLQVFNRDDGQLHRWMGKQEVCIRLVFWELITRTCLDVSHDGQLHCATLQVPIFSLFIFLLCDAKMDIDPAVHILSYSFYPATTC